MKKDMGDRAARTKVMHLMCFSLVEAVDDILNKHFILFEL